MARMWVCVHTLTGLALGALSPWSLGLTLLAALVLHVLLDLVPHWDYSSCPRVVLWAGLDVGASAVALLVVALTIEHGWIIALVGWVSALPDLDVFDALLPEAKRRRWFPSHWSSFPHGRASPAFGITVQMVLVLASFLAIVLSQI